MINQFPKDHDEQLSENFWLREFRCHCVFPDCKTTYICEELIEGLQALRDAIGEIKILSGFRCTEHNASIGGKPKSQHLIGIAADCHSLKLKPPKLAGAAVKIGCFESGGIGLYSWGVHLDVRGIKARW